MAYKRHLKFDRPAEAAEPEVGEESTGQWVRSTLLKYWFVAGAVFLDVMVPLEVQWAGGGGLFTSLALVVLLALVVAEAYLYTRLWGREGIFNFDEDEED